VSNEKLDYMNYLQVDTIISAQKPMSDKAGKPVHIEMLYLIVHQAYELWFKQILHELDSVVEMFDADNVDERNIGVAVSRLQRVTKIQNLLIEQIDVLETMTPLEFLDFRHLLGTASGFQSFQFRLLENRLGLRREDRMSYGGKEYYEEFTGERRESLIRAEGQPTLFSVVASWLERTPFLDFGEFHFADEYQRAADRMLEAERASAQGNPNDMERSLMIDSLDNTAKTFRTFLDESEHSALVLKGHRRLSYKATMAALFISLYRYEPILQEPFRLLSVLVDIDENFATWRGRHALMVHRMLGKKMGTGQSSGYDYLRRTIDRYRVFADLFNLSTLLIPRSEIPELPLSVATQLAFHHSVRKLAGSDELS
jgi:tryptophan 2,3-dioxygenase